MESGWEFGFSHAFLVHDHRPICGFSGCSLSSRLSFLSLVSLLQTFSLLFVRHLIYKIGATYFMGHVPRSSHIGDPRHIIQYSYSHRPHTGVQRLQFLK
jgi:hypothetical protein